MPQSLATNHLHHFSSMSSLFPLRLSLWPPSPQPPYHTNVTGSFLFPRRSQPTCSIDFDFDCNPYCVVSSYLLTIICARVSADIWWCWQVWTQLYHCCWHRASFRFDSVEFAEYLLFLFFLSEKFVWLKSRRIRGYGDEVCAVIHCFFRDLFFSKKLCEVGHKTENAKKCLLLSWSTQE